MSAVAPASSPLLAAPRRLLRLRSDAALAGRFAAGDEASFAILYERHRTSVLAVCIGVLGSRHDAEDAAQEAFAALAQCHAPPENVAAWLTRVARNAAIDVARRRRDGSLPPEDVPDPAGSGDARAELESVMAGIRELPEAQRTALLMRELGGHSYREIGSLLDLNEAAVRGLIARARIGLRAYREASETSCETVRAALAVAPDDLAVHSSGIRRHVRGCPACRHYRRGLRRDARALRALIGPVVPVAGLGALLGRIAAKATKGGLVTKGALLGGAVNQLTAACAVSVCAVGGFALLHPGAARRHPVVVRHSHVRPAPHRRAAPAPSIRSAAVPDWNPRRSTGSDAAHTGGRSTAPAIPRPNPTPVAGPARTQQPSSRSGGSALLPKHTQTARTTPTAATQRHGAAPSAPTAASPTSSGNLLLQMYDLFHASETQSPLMSWMTQLKGLVDGAESSWPLTLR